MCVHMYIYQLSLLKCHTNELLRATKCMKSKAEEISPRLTQLVCICIWEKETCWRLRGSKQ